MTSPPTVGDRVLRRLGAETSAVSLEAWIQPLTVREDPERLVLLAPSAFHRERVSSHVASRLGGPASEVGGRPIEVAIQLAPECDSASRARFRCAAPAPAPSVVAAVAVAVAVERTGA